MYTHTHTYTHSLTHTHPTHMHSCTHTHTCTHTHILSLSLSHAFTHMQAHTYSHTHMHAQTHTVSNFNNNKKRWRGNLDEYYSYNERCHLVDQVRFRSAAWFAASAEWGRHTALHVLLLRLCGLVRPERWWPWQCRHSQGRQRLRVWDQQVLLPTSCPWRMSGKSRQVCLCTLGGIGIKSNIFKQLFESWKLSTIYHGLVLQS